MNDTSPERLFGPSAAFPRVRSFLLELTYRCPLACVHCYCKGSEARGRELTGREWRAVIDKAAAAGVLYLTFSGGEPLLHHDFPALYRYAKKRGLLITLYTSGQCLTPALAALFRASPPYAVEMTVNGATAAVYESITGVPGSFARAMDALELLRTAGIPTLVKANCLRQNKEEIGALKRLAERFFGRPGGRHAFLYDPLIFPRLNGDRTPCQYRLTHEELTALRSQDAQIWQEHCVCAERAAGLTGDDPMPYRCGALRDNLLVDPFGTLRFCGLTDRCAQDARTADIRAYLRGVQEFISGQYYPQDSPCPSCEWRGACYHCPPRASLETGEEFAPVPYYCAMARAATLEKRGAAARAKERACAP